MHVPAHATPSVPEWSNNPLQHTVHMDVRNRDPENYRIACMHVYRYMYTTKHTCVCSDTHVEMHAELYAYR